jgi:catechol 2,3-dioxygenase-like lactoylglutathione lyase family enzyme
MGFGHAIPILRVASVDAAVDYYTRALGFSLQWGGPIFACVARDSASIMLSQGDQGHPGSWLWIGVPDADALHDELRASAAFVRHPPTNYPWGSRELHVSDLDGNVLRFGSDVKAGEPMGEWLDGEGVRWLPQPDGGWRRAG